MVVVDSGDFDSDLVGDVTEVLASFCALLYGRRGACNRAEKTLRRAKSCVRPGS